MRVRDCYLGGRYLYSTRMRESHGLHTSPVSLLQPLVTSTGPRILWSDAPDEQVPSRVEGKLRSLTESL